MRLKEIATAVGAEVVGEIRGCQVDRKVERRYPDAAAVVDASV